MKRRRVIYEGKAKILYEGTEPGTVIQYFKDDATAGNGAKKDTIEGKGVLNNRISEYLMTQLAGIGVPAGSSRPGSVCCPRASALIASSARNQPPLRSMPMAVMRYRFGSAARRT